MTETAEMQEAEPILFLAENGEAIAVEYGMEAVLSRFANMPPPAVGRKLLPLYSQSDFDAMRAQRDEARDEIKRLRRLATDRAYMIDAYRAILSETGEKVAAAWDEKGVRRIHFDWGPKAWSMTGEERAKFILDLEAARKTEVKYIDGEPSPSNSGDTP